MKIAFCAPFPVENFLPDVGLRNESVKSHPCSWIRVLSEKLSREPGIELHIITISPNLREDYTVRRDNITYHLLDSSLSPLVSRIIRLDPTSSLWLKPLVKMRSRIRRLKPDIVHGHGTESCFSLMAVYSGYPNVISIQGIIAQVYQIEPSKRSRIVRHIEAHTIRKAKYINVKTRNSDQYVQHISPRSERFMIEAPISEIFWNNHHPPYNRRMFFVGPLIKRKGIDEFVHSFIAIHKLFPDTLGYVVGEGSPEAIEHFKRITGGQGCEQSLIFTGQIDHAALCALYAQGGVYCLTSYVENSPNVIMEAMAAGLPVVASDVGSVKDLMEDGVSGFVVEKGSFPPVFEAVKKLFQNQQLFHDMGQRGRSIASSRWRPEIIVQKHIAMYRHIIDRGISIP